MVNAAPIEDEPLPFDTRMPKRAASPVYADVPSRPTVAPVAQTERCRTVLKKVRGRKVRQQVCTKVTKSTRVSKSTRQVTRKTVSHKKAVVTRKSRKRR